MNEVTQLKKLMEAVAYSEAQYDDEPFIQAHNLPDDSIYDAYQAGNISYDEAEAKLKQMYRNDPDELDVAMATLNTYYGDQEVEWDEESGGGVFKEDSIEGELLTKDRTTTAGIARDIIKGAGASLYKDGMKPTAGSILQRSEKMAGAFYNQLLMAIDKELGN